MKYTLVWTHDGDYYKQVTDYEPTGVIFVLKNMGIKYTLEKS